MIYVLSSMLLPELGAVLKTYSYALIPSFDDLRVHVRLRRHSVFARDGNLQLNMSSMICTDAESIRL